MTSDSIKLFVGLLRDIWGKMGGSVLTYLAATMVSGLLEGVTLASVVPLLMASGIGGGNASGKGMLAELSSNILGIVGIQPTPSALVVTVIFAFLLSGLFFLLQAHLGFRLQTSYMFSWHQRIFESVFGAQWRFFVMRQTGDIVNAATTETSRIGGAFYQATLLISGIVHSIIYFAVAATLSLSATIGVISGGVVMFLATRPITKRAYSIGTGISENSATLQQSLIEFVGGAKLLKATATEAVAVSALSRTAAAIRSLGYRNNFDVQLVKALFDFGSATLVAVIIVVGSSSLQIDPAVTLVILAIFVRLLPKLTGIQQGLQSLSVSLPALASLQQLHADAVRQAEPPSVGTLPEQLSSGPLSLELQGLSVSYASHHVLKDITLSIPAGKVVAFVGGSGAGKTTLVDAILGIVEPCKGELLVNGLSLKGLPRGEVRARIGYIAQETIIYNDTVRSNVLWGHPAYHDERIAEVARQVSAWEFISCLPEGLDTKVGERGARFSGGERQRLALIRALLGDPGLLVLDEATSALDAETEKAVIDSIGKLRGQVTVLMIAHRLSSVRAADCIYVMDEGRIVEFGPWEKLAHTGTRFWKLWALQKGEKQ